MLIKLFNNPTIWFRDKLLNVDLCMQSCFGLNCRCVDVIIIIINVIINNWNLLHLIKCKKLLIMTLAGKYHYTICILKSVSLCLKKSVQYSWNIEHENVNIVEHNKTLLKYINMWKCFKNVYLMSFLKIWSDIIKVI